MADDGYLLSLIRRFPDGVNENHLHTFLYIAQELELAGVRYRFYFQHVIPFSEQLDLEIAMLLWGGDVSIKQNRIRANDDSRVIHDVNDLLKLDKLFAFSYNKLKALAAMIHMERDMQKTRQEALASAVRLFPIKLEEAEQLFVSCAD